MGGAVFGKKYRLLGWFVGNVETGHGSTAIGSVPSDFKVLFSRKIGNIFVRCRVCGFLLEIRPLKFNSVPKLDTAALT